MNTDPLLLFAAAVFMVLITVGDFCGPGRGGMSRRKPRKLTPLVFKQMLPPVTEKSLSASGLSNGKITRDDPNFRQLLIPSYSRDIIFADEEGTGSDRFLTTRCHEKLNILAVSVMNQWPGLRLRVTEGFDEDNYHEPESLHYEGRAVDITLSDRDRSKLGMLARLAVHAGFDFVYFSSRSHIHASVKSENQADVGRSGGCFKSDSTVYTPTGIRKMSQLAIGDEVLVSREDDGTLHYSKIILFLDRNANEERVFKTIVTNRNKVTLTPSHLIFVQRDNEIQNERFATFAKNVEPGDYILVKANNTKKVSLEKVERVFLTREKGFYSPLTAEGNILVDNILSSCYAVFYNQTLAHLAFLPLRVSNNFQQAIHHFLRKFNFIKRTNRYFVESHRNPDAGIHIYPRILYLVAHYLLPEEYFYQ